MKIFKKNNRVNIEHKLKNKGKLIPYSAIELSFNIISLLFAIGVGFYFGIRSFYYYGKLQTTTAKAALTLNGSIIQNNKIITDGDGLHQDKDGYYFKGNVFNNYVIYANRLFRVIRVNNDGSIRLVSQDIVSEFMWGEDTKYQGSNLDKWLDKKDNIAGTGVYYDTLPYVKDFLTKTEYKVPKFDGKTVTNGTENTSSYISTLSIKDYSMANGKNSFLNIQKYFWLLGNSSDGNNLYVSEDGTLLEGNIYESYGIRPVITLKPDTPIEKGTGSSVEPYVVNQGDKINYVHRNVRLGDYVFKIFYDKDDVVKLVYTNYYGGKPYSNVSSLFNKDEKGSLPNLLNTEFYNAIPNTKLLDTIIYTGEVSSDTSLDFTNIYNSQTTAKVGMLNLFDYHLLGGDDYFVSNTTQSVGSLAYVYHNYGLLEEVNVTDIKNTIPVITLSKKDIDCSQDECIVR